MKRKLGLMAAITILAAYATACSASGESSPAESSLAGERDLLRQVEASISKAQAVDPKAGPDAAAKAYLEAISAITKYLDQYPDGKSAAEMRDRREKFYAETRAIRGAGGDYQQVLRQELNDKQPQLPSDCGRMAKMWQEYLDSHPGSNTADEARRKKARWEAKLKEEIERGFQISIESVEVQSVKGTAHRAMAGRPWDPAISGPQIILPDPYAVMEMDGKPVIYTQPARNTLSAQWTGQHQVLQVSDDKEVSITVRDRDVAEKAAVILIGGGLFTFAGVEAVREAMKRDDDDDICRWSGTIRNLIEKGNSGLTTIGDCGKLRVKVNRPR